MNRVIIIGNLTRDPDLKYTPSGTAVTTFTVAVNRPRTNQAGEREADFINVVAWQKLADLCATYLKKGRKAAVEGRLQTRSYDNQEGKKVFVTEVVAERVEFLGTKEGGGGDNEPGFVDPFADAGKPINISDDDLPF